mmetsp:Transcript_85316/g.217395  ORF Transcript_85316/g.217395 Transcript_85316/m.217395 type:complete len:435 (-) Transcript_85316:83-1387(-)
MVATGLASITGTVIQAVLTIAVTGAPGFVAGFRGLIDQEFLRSLARFKMDCLTPCLIFATFGSRLTLERLGRVWPLVVWSCVQLCTGVVVSAFLARANASAEWARPGSVVLPRLLELAVCFQNIGAFSLPMLQTLCQADGIFGGRDAQSCFEDGALMVFGYHVPWDLAMWTQGYSCLQALAALQKPSEGALASVQVAALLPDPRGLPAQRRPTKFPRHLLQRLTLQVQACGRARNPIFAAMTLGMLVGLMPPLRQLFFGAGAPLEPVGAGLKRVGGIVPVLALQMLSGTLGCASRQLLRLEPSKSPKASPAGAAGPMVQPAALASWVAAILVGKLVLMPALGFAAFAALARLRRGAGGGLAMGPSDALWPDDRLLRTVVILQWSAPSCLSLISLCYRVSLGESVTQAVAALYLVMYAAIIVTTTFWVSAGLMLF